MARVSPYTGRENRWNLAWPTDHHRPAIPLNGASKSRSSRWDPPIQAARQRGSTSINPQGKHFSPALSGFPSELFKHNDRLYVYIHRGETLSLSLSLSPLEFDDLLEKNIGGKKKGGRRGLTPIRRRTMGENRIAQRVWKRPIPWQMKARYEHTYIYRVHATSLQFSHPLVRNLCVYCNFSVRFQFVNPKNSQSRKRKRERKLIRRSYIQDYFEIT